MKRIVITGITILLMISICFSVFAYAGVHEEKNVIVKPYDIESKYLLFTSKGGEIQFNITSNLSVHVYLMTSDAYHDTGLSPYGEDDFSVNVFEKKNVQKANFTWTQPDDQSYYIIIFNPNDQNATISYSYTETLFEELSGELGELFSGICVGAMCFVGVILYFIISLVIGIWMYKDADERGKNGAIWFIMGVILSIIGLIIWFIIRPKTYKEKTERKEVTRTCPYCGRNIPEDARTCPYCSKKFW